MVNYNQKKMIQAKNSRNVTSLKPRFGIFKHESDLFALFAAEMAATIFCLDGCNDACARQEDVVRELYKQYCEVSTELHHELEKWEKLKQVTPLSIDKMNPNQLHVLKVSLERLEQQVLKQREEHLAKTTNSPTPSSSDMYSTEDPATSFKN